MRRENPYPKASRFDHLDRSPWASIAESWTATAFAGRGVLELHPSPEIAMIAVAFQETDLLGHYTLPMPYAAAPTEPGFGGFSS